MGRAPFIFQGASHPVGSRRRPRNNDADLPNHYVFTKTKPADAAERAEALRKADEERARRRAETIKQQIEAVCGHRRTEKELLTKEKRIRKRLGRERRHDDEPL